MNWMPTLTRPGAKPGPKQLAVPVRLVGDAPITHSPWAGGPRIAPEVGASVGQEGSAAVGGSGA